MSRNAIDLTATAAECQQPAAKRLLLTLVPNFIGPVKISALIRGGTRIVDTAASLGYDGARFTGSGKNHYWSQTS